MGDVNEVLFPVYAGRMPDFLPKFLQTDAMKRIAGVGMNCGLEYTSFPRYKDTAPYSRYSHSVGTALIVWHFTRDEKQTLAGLFHDIAAPVFAHVVDFAHGDYEKQEYTEKSTAEVIRKDGQIMALLEEEGIRAEEVEDYHRYPIADNDAPKLSADRLEYTLGNFLNYGFGTVEDDKRFYQDLYVGKNEEGQDELSFRHRKLAADFARRTLSNGVIYSTDEDRWAMETLAGILNRALRRGVLEAHDLGTTEREVIRKMEGDEEIRRAWENYRKSSRIYSREDEPEEEGWIKVSAKKRWIDPLAGGIRISRADKAAAEAIRSFRNRSFDHWIKAE